MERFFLIVVLSFTWTHQALGAGKYSTIVILHSLPFLFDSTEISMNK